jgi:hypothetical protein
MSGLQIDGVQIDASKSTPSGDTVRAIAALARLDIQTEAEELARQFARALEASRRSASSTSTASGDIAHPAARTCCARIGGPSLPPDRLQNAPRRRFLSRRRRSEATSEALLEPTRRLASIVRGGARWRARSRMLCGDRSDDPKLHVF